MSYENGNYYDDGYTGATQRIADVRDPQGTAPMPEQHERIVYVERGRAQRFDPITVAIVIGGAALAMMLAQSPRGAGYAAPPPPPPSIVIHDDSWNWNVCGICTRGNASPHFEVQQP